MALKTAASILGTQWLLIIATLVERLPMLELLLGGFGGLADSALDIRLLISQNDFHIVAISHAFVSIRD